MFKEDQKDSPDPGGSGETETLAGAKEFHNEGTARKRLAPGAAAANQPSRNFYTKNPQIEASSPRSLISPRSLNPPSATARRAPKR